MEESKSKIKWIGDIKNYIPRKWIGIYIIWLTLHFILFLLAGANNHFDSDFWPINRITPRLAYDYTEFLIYSIVPILIFLAFYFLRSENKNLKTDDSQEKIQAYKVKKHKEEPINYSDKIKDETNEYENQDLIYNNANSKNQDAFVVKEIINTNKNNIERVENTSYVYVYLWIFYPFLMLLLAYIKLSLSWGDTFIHPATKIAEVIGTAAGIFVIPLIIVGIRRFFTKKKLSSLSYVIFFYVVSLLSFFFSTFGTYYSSSH